MNFGELIDRASQQGGGLSIEPERSMRYQMFPSVIGELYPYHLVILCVVYQSKSLC